MVSRKTITVAAGCSSIILFLLIWPISRMDFPGDWHLVILRLLLAGAFLLALVAALLGSKWWALAALLPFALAVVIYSAPI